MTARATLALLMTDVEGSTRLWSTYPDLMNGVMARHHELAHAVIAEHGGWRPVDQGEGDAVFAAFESASDAVAAAVQLQRLLAEEEWPAGITIRDRVGVHAGEVIVRDGNLFGPTVNRAARIRSLGAGGQVLLSAAVHELVRDRVPDGVTLTDLGEHRMKDLARPERIHQVDIPGLRTRFPPLAGLDRAATNLPVQTSSFVGREAEARELVELVERNRLVTLTGFGGIGKTRLALQVAAELIDGMDDGVWFVDLSTLRDAVDIESVIATTLGLQGGTDETSTALAGWLAGRRLLLVLDNLEQLLPAAALVVDRLLAAGPGVRVLATSREPLRLRGERIHPVGALPVPPLPTGGVPSRDGLGALSTYEAVSLFLVRAESVRPDFSLTAANAAAVAAICVRLEGLPLALELAAARLRVISPEALLPRLERALTVLTGGSRDLPARQQTLRATIAWSYDTAPAEQQRLLDRFSVFPGTFTFDAAEQVAARAATGEEDADVLDGLTDLVDRSLVRHHPAAAGGEDRYSLLVPIREYGAERLAADGLTGEFAARHADYYRRLVALPPDPDHADWDLRDRHVHGDWHNLRTALQHFRDQGRHDAEIAIAADVAEPLSHGAPGEARAVVDGALRHLPDPVESPDHVRLLLMKMRWVSLSRGEASREWAHRALAAARHLGEPSLLAYALGWAAQNARSREESAALLAEAKALLDALPAKGNAWPRWSVKEVWETTAMVTGLIGPAEGERIMRDRLAEAEGGPKLRQTFNLGLFLADWGRLEDALDVLRPFEQGDPMVALDRPNSLAAAGYAVELRLELGDVEGAERAQAQVREQLKEVDVPEEALLAELHEAALERLAGRTSDAIRRLESALAHSAGEVTAGIEPDVGWLLAVVRREGGDRDGAFHALRAAWAGAGQDYQNPAVWLILLERAAALIGTDPRRAARLVGLVRARCEVPLLHRGVSYDMDAMQAEIRSALGRSVADALLAEGGASELPDVLPEDQDERDVVEQPHG